MAFSDAFARSYAVGDAMRKRRATANYFKKLKELTADTDDMAEAIPTEVAGMDVAPEGAAPAPETALPIQPAGESGTAPILAPVEGVGTEAIPMKGPDKLPLATEKQRQALAKSLTRDNIKELDDLAMIAGEASGDAGVYKALRDTTTSMLQTKALAALGQAQTAAQEGDVDATEKFLSKAYRYIPDGREAKFKRKDGKLWIENPWKTDEGEPKEIELDAQRIGGLAVLMSDPAKYAELLREEGKEREDRKFRRKELDLRERGVGVQEGQLGVAQENAALRAREVAIKEQNAPVERLATWADIAYKQQMTEASKASAKDPKIMEGATALVRETNDQFVGMTTAPNDEMGRPDPNWKMPDQFFKTDANGNPVPLSDAEMLTANALAQSIAVAGLGRTTPGMAIEAGLALVKGRDPNSNFNLQVNAQTGEVYVPINGVNTPVQLPKSILEGLVQEEMDARYQRGPTSGNQNPRR